MNDKQAETAKTKLIEYFRENFPDFCEQLLKIRDEDGNLIPFVFNRMQRKRWEDDVKPAIAAWKAGSREPAYFIDLKARQEGDSTFWQALSYWYATLWPLRECLTVAHLTRASAHLFGMQKRFLKHSPMKLHIKSDNRGVIHFDSRNREEDGLDSKITIDTAGNENLGRSFTYNFVHLSEFASFQDVDPEAVLLALYQSIPETSWVFVVMESTAKGEGLFKELWYGNNRWKKCFISWLALDKYSRDIDPKDYFELEVSENTTYGDEVRESENVRKELIYWYPVESADPAWLDHEVMRRLNWRRWMIENKIPSHDKNDFRQEYPTTQEDAFRAAGLSVFDTRVLADIRDMEIEAQKVNPPTTYRWFPTYQDSQHKQWWRDCWLPAKFGNLEEFETPLVGVAYLLTADPTEGLDQKADDAGAIVWRLPEMIEVATYDGICNPEEFGYMLYAIQQRWNNAFLIPEVNNPGQATMVILKQLGARMYVREIFDRIAKTITMAYGWKTTTGNKHIMIGALRQAIVEGRIQPRSLRTIKQWMQYQRKVSKSKQGLQIERPGIYGPPVGGYAGLVISGALAVQAENVPAAYKINKPKGQLDRQIATADWWGKFADDPEGSGVPFV